MTTNLSDNMSGGCRLGSSTPNRETTTVSSVSRKGSKSVAKTRRPAGLKGNVSDYPVFCAVIRPGSTSVPGRQHIYKDAEQDSPNFTIIVSARTSA